MKSISVHEGSHKNKIVNEGIKNLGSYKVDLRPVYYRETIETLPDGTVYHLFFDDQREAFRKLEKEMKKNKHSNSLDSIESEILRDKLFCCKPLFKLDPRKDD